jgi:hypothetical protein
MDPDHTQLMPYYSMPGERAPLGKAVALPPVLWGAIAISPTLGWGYSNGFKSQAAAEAEALRRCNDLSKRGPCKLASSASDTCFSLATSPPDNIYVIGGTIGAINYANSNALLKCQRAGGKSCIIKASFCADGVQHNTPMPSAPFGRSVRK